MAEKLEGEECGNDPEGELEGGVGGAGEEGVAAEEFAVEGLGGEREVRFAEGGGGELGGCGSGVCGNRGVEE